MAVSINFSPDGLTAFGELNDSMLKLSWRSKDEIPSLNKLQEIFSKALDQKKVEFKFKKFDLPLKKELRMVKAIISEGSNSAVLWIGCATVNIPLNYAVPDFKNLKITPNSHLRFGVGGRLHAYWVELRNQ